MNVSGVAASRDRQVKSYCSVAVGVKGMQWHKSGERKATLEAPRLDVTCQESYLRSLDASGGCV